MQNTLSHFLTDIGLTPVAASKKSGIPYITIMQHIRGKRGISPQSAMQYERLLGIPRSELRPDLWPPEQPELQKAE